ncbi:galactose oxidase/kelch repeat superfamily protein [Carex rostrata]
MAGTWTKFAENGCGPGARSSHAVTIVGTKAYSFGGEFTPRVPVDNKMYSFDLTSETWSILDCTGDIPPPRVGVTMVSVANTIYVFGGRDYEHKELNEFYSFDTLTNEWTLLSSDEASPPHRSYHSMTADEKQIFIFGGCGNSGRLNDLWAYNTVTSQWAQLPYPGDTCSPRGGPGLVVTGGKIWVVYGFAGMEVDDVHCFDLKTEKWSLVETTGEKPSARSVFSAVAVGKYVVMYGGEVDPSDLGHLGAGKFSADVYVLDTESLVWTKLDDASEQHPGPRGWCAFSAGEIDGKSGLLVYGGNSPTNDRLGDFHFFAPNL